ncbi:hypothetical protein CRG98_015647 [Punica granatum]|uniref:RNase H type-1 domain-containing protein n=1 Tax=Punica granatum TaxID=22663 RepID=A0A2I0K5Z7_PUNGR|nr:hypothetical protein CRG98_015647 [Punica granatum]
MGVRKVIALTLEQILSVSNATHLGLVNCSRLAEISGSDNWGTSASAILHDSPQTISLQGCKSLSTKFKEFISEDWQGSGLVQFIIPGSHIPERGSIIRPGTIHYLSECLLVKAASQKQLLACHHQPQHGIETLPPIGRPLAKAQTTRIWKWRNSLLFSQRALHPDLKQLVLQLAAEFYATMEPVSRQKSSQISVIWTPPPQDFFKLNSDGSSRGSTSAAGAGGVIRDAHGRFVYRLYHESGSHSECGYRTLWPSTGASSCT